MLGSLAFIDGEAFIPFLESFAAVLLEFLVCREKQFAGIFYRLIEFAEIVVVLATYPGPSFVDAADTMWQEVAAVCLNVQKPTIGILKYIDAFMGNLIKEYATQDDKGVFYINKANALKYATEVMVNDVGMHTFWAKLHIDDNFNKCW